MPLLHQAQEARRKLGVPALGLGLVDADGQLEHAVTGTRQRGHNGPALDTDRWHLGSCGKSITAALYARLVETGRAEWSMPVKALFSDLRLDPGWDAVTIDDLLLHLSGAPAYMPLRRAAAYSRDTRPLADQRTEVSAEMYARPPMGFGKFRYSNLGYTVIGAAIERITGEPYESALQTHLFVPLGIRSAGFGPPPEIRGHRGRMRIGHRVLGRGPACDPADPASDNPAVITPAGRMHMSIADWSRFQRLWLRGGSDKLLSEASVQRMLRTPAGGPYAMGWAPARGLDGVSFGQQGSNTYWVATALLDQDRRRSAMVIVNDGRTAMLRQTARIAAQLLAGGFPPTAEWRKSHAN
jgi:D-alanyl-D-alanine carboxypeptidase